jgi:hypothetical protein
MSDGKLISVYFSLGEDDDVYGFAKEKANKKLFSIWVKEKIRQELYGDNQKPTPLIMDLQKRIERLEGGSSKSRQDENVTSDIDDDINNTII